MAPVHGLHACGRAFELHREIAIDSHGDEKMHAKHRLRRRGPQRLARAVHAATEDSQKVVAVKRVQRVGAFPGGGEREHRRVGDVHHVPLPHTEQGRLPVRARPKDETPRAARTTGSAQHGGRKEAGRGETVVPGGFREKPGRRLHAPAVEDGGRTIPTFQSSTPRQWRQRFDRDELESDIHGNDTDRAGYRRSHFYRPPDEMVNHPGHLSGRCPTPQVGHAHSVDREAPVKQRGHTATMEPEFEAASELESRKWSPTSPDPHEKQHPGAFAACSPDIGQVTGVKRAGDPVQASAVDDDVEWASRRRVVADVERFKPQRAGDVGVTGPCDCNRGGRDVNPQTFLAMPGEPRRKIAVATADVENPAGMRQPARRDRLFHVGRNSTPAPGRLESRCRPAGLPRVAVTVEQGPRPVSPSVNRWRTGLAMVEVHLHDAMIPGGGQ